MAARKKPIASLDERIGSERLARVSDMLRTAAHPQRLAILDVLGSGGRLCNSEIQERIGVEQAILSQHLTLLRDKGVLTCEREGKYTYWRIRIPGFLAIVRSLENCCEEVDTWK